MQILKQHLFLDTIGCRRGRILVEFDKALLSEAGRKIVDDLIHEWDFPAKYGQTNTEALLVPYGLRIEPEKPVIADPVFQDDPKPWEKYTDGNGVSALYDPDDKLYKMWYQARQLSPEYGIELTNGRGEPAENTLRVCYAYSEDGANWVRPELPYVLCNGQKTNMLDLELQGGTMFFDGMHRETGKFKLFDAWYFADRTDLTPHQRVFTRLRVSDNGLDWREVETEPLNYFFDTQNIMDYDEGLGKYVAYMRDHYNGRAISRCESDDPTHMPKPQTLLHPDNFDAPDVDYYTNGFTFYPHDKSIRLLFPSIYSQQTDQTTVRMGVSRNGRNFQWVSRGDIIGNTFPNGDFAGQMYVCPGMLAIGDKVAMAVWTTLTRHDEYRIISAYSNPPDEEHRIRFAYWDRDRLAGITSGQSTGEIYDTVSISGKNPRLQLNMRSQGMGRVRVEVLVGQCFEPASGFGLGDSNGLCGDLQWTDYQWKEHTSLAVFDGKDITLRFHIESAKLFGYRLICDETGSGQDTQTGRIESSL